MCDVKRPGVCHGLQSLPAGVVNSTAMMGEWTMRVSNGRAEAGRVEDSGVPGLIARWRKAS
jgi:hypothetical protein